MTIIRKPCPPENFRKGRGGQLVAGIVIHITDGLNDKGGVDAHFANPASQVSAHYLVCRDGTIHQYVDEAASSFHAGIVDHPTWWLAIEDPHRVNQRTIGIEHEGWAKDDISDQQYATSAELIADICHRHLLPIDDGHIVGHHEVRAGKSCPGKVDVAKLIAAAKEISKTAPIS